jgi:phospholipid/cholesterol/gamma-HCH transport system permease protein
MFRHIGELIILLLQALGAMPVAWRQRAKVKEQLFEIGNASLLMVCILSLFIGGVVSLNTGPVLVSRGLGSALGGLVGISVCKELAPVMMAILIAGRIGSSMAAEIGWSSSPSSSGGSVAPSSRTTTKRSTSRSPASSTTSGAWSS